MPRIAAALLLVMGAALRGGPLVAQERSVGAAWAIEAAGGALGSAAGFGLGLLLVDDDCGEDIVCILEDVAAVLGLASAGSAVGAPAMITFTLSQGIVTALGSRVGAASR